MGGHLDVVFVSFAKGTFSKHVFLTSVGDRDLLLVACGDVHRPLVQRCASGRFGLDDDLWRHEIQKLLCCLYLRRADLFLFAFSVMVMILIH
jgi:hypothetical protein